MNSIPVLFQKKSECCGCSACAASCAVDAITMKEDAEGFEYPVVDDERCVRCYRCLLVCPLKTT